MTSYETAQDLEHELAIKAAVESRGKVRLVKLKKFSRVDFVMTEKNGNAIALCETKTRNHAKQQHETLFIDYNKMETAIYLCRHFYNEATMKPLDFILFIQFIDGIMFYKFNPEDRLTIKEGGRRDRNDRNDIQPLVHIPLKLFKNL